MSLSDAATASDALDNDLSERLGPAPESTAGEGGAPTRPASRRSHHKAKPGAARAAPLASELQRPLTGILALFTLVIGLLLCGFRFDDPLVDIITLDNERHEGEEESEAQAIARPAANILSRQKWFAQYGHMVVNSDDAIALVWGVIGYLSRVGPAVQQRMQDNRASRGQRASTQQSQGLPGGRVQPSANGYAAGSVSGLGAYSPD